MSFIRTFRDSKNLVLVYQEETAMGLSMKKKYQEIALCLLDYVVDNRKIRDYHDYTALHVACMNKYDRIAMKIIAKTPIKFTNDLFKVSDKVYYRLDGERHYKIYTPFDFCCKDPIMNDVGLLLIERQTDDDILGCMLLTACAESNVLLATRIIEKIRDVSKLNDYYYHTDTEEKTALHYCCKKIIMEPVALLLIERLSEFMLMEETEHKKTALHLCIESGMNRVACELIRKVNSRLVNPSSQYWGTPLIYACSKRNTEIAMELVRKVYNLHWYVRSSNYNYESQTALHLAIENKMEGVAREIIMKCTPRMLQEINATNTKKTVITLARENGYGRLAEMITQKMAISETRRYYRR